MGDATGPLKLYVLPR